jgi:hypothetical protein
MLPLMASLHTLSPVPNIRERWRTSFIEARIYDWAVEYEHVAGVLPASISVGTAS